ncbi:Diphthamide biosynthesis protein-like protein [Emericellopsis cladophorae]|uniref:methylated diphthine methylhydrolase n=1 Tax=Emericellopsis cladophorae TaxID=2686198 RepID=A0A9P9XXH8_9HYPO|nr:Diphthamide biosynthesis protein-like protein [Emericellopsis cladophorae]KAI6779652.1 Diphthamide biosynthesis protein-like protein [Emericellopsis cladophorae]
MGVTTSAGSARLLQLDEQWRICDWTDLDIANTLEAWCIAFAPSGRELASSGHTTVYCGGDDSILRYTTSAYGLYPRATEDVEVAAQPSILKNQHNAGVTAIFPLDAFDAEGSRLVITGSYDDNIRLFAVRDPDPAAFTKRAELLAEENLEGGVWRLDLVHANASAECPIFCVLASCMYAGARLVQFARDKQGIWQCDIAAKFEEHQSMNYGCAFVLGSEGEKSLQCVSTSFYDKMICLWDVELKLEC